MSALERGFVNRRGRTRGVAARLVRMLEPLAPVPGASLLDVGCGDGAAALGVGRRFGLSVRGIDVDPEQVRRARLAGDPATAAFDVGDAARLPYPDASYDFVVSHHATHHIPAWHEALAEMIRVLRPGGHLVYVDLLVPAVVASLWRPARTLPTRRGVATALCVPSLERLAWASSPVHCAALLRRVG